MDKAKAEEEAKKLGLIHMETSAKTGHNINEAFKTLVRETVRTSFEYKVRHAQESYRGRETALHTTRELNMDGRSYLALKSDLSGQPLIGQCLLLLCYSALKKMCFWLVRMLQILSTLLEKCEWSVKMWTYMDSPNRKGNSRLTKLLGGLSYENNRKYNNSPPYVTARWPPQL